MLKRTIKKKYLAVLLRVCLSAGKGKQRQSREMWAGGAARLKVGLGSICSWGELSYSGNHCLHCCHHQRHPKLGDLSLPHCLWLPPTSPEAAAAPQPFLVSSISWRCAEPCLCLGSSRSYSAMQRMCALKKNLDKNLTLRHFSHLFAQTKKIHLQHEAHSC